jgi:phosphoglucomutase
MKCYATPTGWKFFGNLLDSGHATLCGEESAGTGSDHIREKDGLWAVLMWLNILACRRVSVAEVMETHWQDFGRDYYSRHDYEEVEASTAKGLIEDLRARLEELPGQAFGKLTVAQAEDFSYLDPVDGSVAQQQGIQIYFEDGARLVLRLSGTGTAGATLRVYMETYAAASQNLMHDAQEALADVISANEALTELTTRFGRTGPDVVT